MPSELHPHVAEVIRGAEQPGDVFDSRVVLSIPMRTRFRGIVTRECMLLRGPQGWAEFSPFLEYSPQVSARWLGAAVEAAALPRLTPQRDSIPVNATIPAVPAYEVPGIAFRYGDAPAVKVKIAERGIDSLEEDVERIAAVRRVFPDADLRCDANGAYTREEALTAMRALADLGLQYIEQPVMLVEELARVREIADAEGIGIPIAADESIRRASDPLRVAELGAADVIIVKAQPLGGVRAAKEVVEASGLPTIVSSAVESAVGISSGLELASVIDQPAGADALIGAEPACGLATAELVVSDLAGGAHPIVGGRIAVGGAEPLESELTKWRAEPDRIEWWEQRLEKCWALLKERAEAAA